MREYYELVNNEEEGMIFQDMNSHYYPGERGKKAWFKLKPDYQGDTMDLVVVGGFLGDSAGRRNLSSAHAIDHMTHFLCAVHETPPEGQSVLGSEQRVVTLAKVGTGFKVEEIKKARDIVRKVAKRYKGLEDAPWMGDWKPTANSRPDFVWPPSDGWVIDVTCAEIVDSDDFAMGKTLRHPRCPKMRLSDNQPAQFIRPDKAWHEAWTRENLEEFISVDPAHRNNRKRWGDRGAGGYEADGDNTSGEEDAPVGKKQRKGPRVDGGGPRNFPIVPHQAFVDTSQEVVVSNIFDGEEFHFLGGARYDLVTREELSRLVVQNGANKLVPMHYKPLTTTRVIAPRESSETRLFVKCQGKEVIRPKWILDCVAQHKLIELHPTYLIHVGDELRAKWEDVMDRYGDKYYEDITPDELAELMDSMDVPTDPQILAVAKKIMDRNPHLMRTPDMPYVGFRVYVDETAPPPAVRYNSADRLAAGWAALEAGQREMERGLLLLKMLQRVATQAKQQEGATHTIRSNNQGGVECIDMKDGSAVPSVLESDEEDDGGFDEEDILADTPDEMSSSRWTTSRCRRPPYPPCESTNPSVEQGSCGSAGRWSGRLCRCVNYICLCICVYTRYRLVGWMITWIVVWGFVCMDVWTNMC
mmetsp:Transcript_8254/g.23499  ORF Transcript_8254/g.23499 Transcript_8254/m.23499 type:complete len:641 (-) Transcript_8254:1035-2957(-)